MKKLLFNKKLKRLFALFWVILTFVFLGGMVAYASTQEEDSIYDQMSLYDFSDIQKELDSEIDFSSMVTRLATGESEGVFAELFNGVIGKIFYEVSYNKAAIAKIILIAIVSSLFTNMSLIFDKSEMSETGFFVTYMLMITVLMCSFGVMSSMVFDVAENIITFMNALVPAFFISVGVSSGSISAVGFCQIALVVLSIGERIIKVIMIPLVNIYVVIMIVNNIVSEDYLSRFAGVVKSFVLWGLKCFVTITLSVNAIQGIILPSIDGVKGGMITKLINILPGGSAITSVGGIITGSGLVVKNAIGSAGAISIAVICAVPILKLIIFIAMYKLTAAVIQPIADKRITKSVDAVAEGVNLLHRIVITLLLLFMVTIAIVCFSTNNMRMG